MVLARSYQADIGIVDDRIVKIGDLSESKSVRHHKC